MPTRQRTDGDGIAERVPGTAAQFIIDGLTACLPPGVPLMGEITRAQFTGKEKARAELTLFDGRPGTVEVSKYGPTAAAWHIRWPSLEGGAFEWTGNEWRRADPIVLQSSLFDGGWPLTVPAREVETR